MHHLPRYPVTGFLKPAVGPNTDRYMFCEEKHRLLHNEEEEREPREQSGKEGREKGRRRKGKRGREGEEREGRAGSSEERYVVGRGWDRQEGMRGKRRGREGTGERGAEQIRRQRLSKLLPHPWAFKSRKPWADLEDQNLQFQSRYFLCGQRKVGVVGGGVQKEVETVWQEKARNPDSRADPPHPACGYVSTGGGTQVQRSRVTQVWAAGWSCSESPWLLVGDKVRQN